MDRSIVICGFPESGKTTYLAALWHLITARAHQTALRFKSLRAGDSTHLNALAKRWRDGLTQVRTDIKTDQLVSMNLIDAKGQGLRLTVPDLSGESYRVMFEDRECSKSLADILTGGEGLLLFIHADRIRAPHLVIDVAAQSAALGTTIPDGQVASWSPTMAPTQVRLVDLLQMLTLHPLSVQYRRVAIILSAWDKVAEEGRTPVQFLEEQLPLLEQYLSSKADGWEWRVYGVSAQGADYEKENQPLTSSQQARLQELRELDEPTERIKVLFEGSESSDLTEPIAWLMS
jgi:hypothetical protein